MLIYRSCRCKNLSYDNIICWLFEVIRLHTQREDGPDTNRLRSIQRNCHSHKKKTKKKHECKSPLTGWKNWLFWHCNSCATRRHIGPYLFIICQDYVLRMSIDLMQENGLKLAMERSRRYPAQNITYADYIDDIVLLSNTPAQAESPLHRLERSAGGLGLHVNVKKTTCTLIKESTSSR